MQTTIIMTTDYYILCDDDRRFDWAEAQSYCQSMFIVKCFCEINKYFITLNIIYCNIIILDSIGTNLASITNGLESTAAEDLQAGAIVNDGTEDVWIGLLHYESNDSYHWIDGVTMNNTFINKKVTNSHETSGDTLSCGEMNSIIGGWSTRTCSTKEYCFLCNMPKYSNNITITTSKNPDSVLHKIRFGISSGSDEIFYIGYNYSYVDDDINNYTYSCLSDFIQHVGFYDDDSSYTLYLNFNFSNCLQSSDNVDIDLRNVKLISQDIIIIASNHNDSLIINDLTFDSYDTIFTNKSGSMEEYTLGNGKICEYIKFTIRSTNSSINSSSYSYSVTFETKNTKKDCPFSMVRDTNTTTQYPTILPTELPTESPVSLSGHSTTDFPAQFSTLATITTENSTLIDIETTTKFPGKSYFSTHFKNIPNSKNNSLPPKIDDNREQNSNEINTVILTVGAIFVAYIFLMCFVVFYVRNRHYLNPTKQKMKYIYDTNNNFKHENYNDKNKKNINYDHFEEEEKETEKDKDDIQAIATAKAIQIAIEKTRGSNMTLGNKHTHNYYNDKRDIGQLSIPSPRSKSSNNSNNNNNNNNKVGEESFLESITNPNESGHIRAIKPLSPTRSSRNLSRSSYNYNKEGIASVDGDIQGNINVDTGTAFGDDKVELQVNNQNTSKYRNKFNQTDEKNGR